MRYIAFAFAIVLTSCATTGSQTIVNFDQGRYEGTAAGLAKLTSQGNLEAQTDLGYLYQYGITVPENEGRALQLFQQAAAQGYSRGLTLEGVLYVSGSVIPHDYPLAINLFKTAAAAGDLQAQENLARMYSEGLGVEKDDSRMLALDAQSAWSKDSLWVGYERAIYGCIERHKFYPRTAVQEHLTGLVHISFSIDRRIAIDVRVVRSSGYPELDAGLVMAAESCVFPYPPPGILPPKGFQISGYFSMNGKR